MKTFIGTVLQAPSRFYSPGVDDCHFDLSVEGRKKPVSIWVRKPFNLTDAPQRLVHVRLGDVITVNAVRIPGSHCYRVCSDSDFLTWGRVINGVRKFIGSQQ